MSRIEREHANPDRERHDRVVDRIMFRAEPLLERRRRVGILQTLIQWSSPVLVGSAGLTAAAFGAILFTRPVAAPAPTEPDDLTLSRAVVEWLGPDQPSDPLEFLAMLQGADR